ncbi:MAG: NTP transferase domain-containing protein [Candidatus Gygaella obscura]|nr:NTP transferase domain-containing protein [Candidatus Gygaella obscura]
MKNVTTVILAAGKGVRMKSQLPKVLHTLCGKPLLQYSIDLSLKLGIKPILVLGSQKDSFKDYASSFKTVFQIKPKGTADAVKLLKKFSHVISSNLVVLYGDISLLRPDTIKNLINSHVKSEAAATVLTTYMDNPTGYGRVVRDNLSNILKIAEEKDATLAEKDIKEINTGIVCFKKKVLFSYINKIKSNNSKKEFYLTDIFSIFREQRIKINSILLEDCTESLGINTQKDLVTASKIMRSRIVDDLFEKGVRIIAPETLFIETDVEIGTDTVIYPYVVIDRNVQIGANCSIGPFCHIRQGSVIKDNNTIGNFTEIVRSKIGKDGFMKHFSYVGDSILGDNVNVGAGVITANFDGREKSITKVKDKAFLGSGTVLVAPVTVGKGAVSGAGSVITKNKNIPDNSVCMGIPAVVKNIDKKKQKINKSNKKKKKK